MDRTGKTQRALAKSLGLDPSAISRLLEGTRLIKADELPKIREFFQPGSPTRVREHAQPANQISGATASESFELIGTMAADSPTAPRKRPGPKPRLGEAKARTIPVLRPLIPLGDGRYELDERIGEYRPCPPQLSGVSGAYALFIPDNALAPRYYAGEVVYIHPGRPPTPASWVVIRLHPKSHTIIIGQLERLNELSIVLSACGQEFTLKRSEISHIGRIVVSSVE